MNYLLISCVMFCVSMVIGFCVSRGLNKDIEMVQELVDLLEDLYPAERNERMTGCNIEMPEGLRWVPIEEEAPPAAHVLVTIKWAENDYEVCEMDYYNWTKLAKEKVAAWMRMPEPYKGGEEE